MKKLTQMQILKELTTIFEKNNEESVFEVVEFISDLLLERDLEIDRLSSGANDEDTYDEFAEAITEHLIDKEFEVDRLSKELEFTQRRLDETKEELVEVRKELISSGATIALQQIILESLAEEM